MGTRLPHQENPDTDYKSGTQFHVEATAAQHFPLAGGLAGMGATGFWYEQLGSDTGDGATLGDFKARSVGFGPVASYVHKVYGHDLLAELKWLHEVDTKRRLEGDTIFLKVLFKFWCANGSLESPEKPVEVHMTSRFRIAISLLACVVGLLPAQVGRAESTRPNIIFIMADDLGNAGLEHDVRVLARRGLDVVERDLVEERLARARLARLRGVRAEARGLPGLCTHPDRLRARRRRSGAVRLRRFLRSDGMVNQQAGHAWAEDFVPDLGWVGFDAANGICTTDAHARVAIGLDYLGAAPVRGTRYGGGNETLTVAVKVDQAGRPGQWQSQTQS